MAKILSHISFVKGYDKAEAITVAAIISITNLQVCCALMDVPFHFRGLSTLKIKETDRIEALKKEMRKLGYVVKDRNNSELFWDGERCEPDYAAGIDTYEDHRMALAFAPASLCIPGLRINNPHVVTKSYPKYWEHLSQCGFRIEMRNEK